MYSLFFSFFLFAHEGHLHAPKSITPPKGGITRSLETVHLELLPKGDSVKLYIYDLKLKPVETVNYPVSATATRPRKDAEKIKLVAEKDHWHFKYDAKGSHRYLFVLTIKQGGHNDKVQWNIEPKTNAETKKKDKQHGHSH